MNGFDNLPMPSIATSREREFARIPVDSAQTSFFEGREFRIVRKLSTPVVYRFTSPVDFILANQVFTITSGEYEFYAWRADNVTASGTWSTSIPVFSKNTSAEQLSPSYQGQATIDTGGSISVIDSNLYADFDWLKTSNSTAQRSSISDQINQGRYLAAGVYYLQFVGTATGSYRLEWEERP